MKGMKKGWKTGNQVGGKVRMEEWEKAREDMKIKVEGGRGEGKKNNKDKRRGNGGEGRRKD